MMSPTKATQTIFRWDESYCLGIAELDEQHRRFFALANELWNLLISVEASMADVQTALVEIFEYAQKHFRTEEKFMAHLDYPEEEMEKHLVAHREYEKEVEEFFERWRRGDESVAKEIVAFSCRWLTQHILDVDVGYARQERILRMDFGKTTVVLRAKADEELARISQRPTSAPEQIGPYRIVGRLGKGGMGVVYKAVHGVLSRVVAVKVLAPEFSEDKSLVARFVREARIVAALQHPNIVSVFDAGEQDGRYFMAMEYIDGISLCARLKKENVIAETEALSYLRQVTRGLAAAHAKGLIHRDIKPENLLIDRDAVMRIVDFGIAKEYRTDNELTQPGMLVGTPYFMSPEQAEGRQLDARSDLYSLGVTFYRALTGFLPFQATGVLEQMYKHKYEKPASPKCWRPDLSEGLERLLLWLLAKRPEDRPDNAQALLELLDKIARGEQIPPPPEFVSPVLPK
jgi:hemerythrin-like metal-binding protein